MTKIYEAKNHILIHTGYDAPAEHCHMAAHIIISMEDAMTVRVEDAEYVCRGIMIPSGVSHRIDTRGKAVLAFLYDGTTNISQQIKDVKIISAEKCMDIITAYVDFEKQEGADAYAKFEREILKRLELSEIDDGIKDERILSAMEYIRREASEKITCRDVAAAVFLSESRFSHLFKEQVGMTFSAYLIYQRIMKVYTQVLDGKSITEAALAAGFSGSSHFADVNRRVFGLSARNITEDMIFKKV